MIKQEVPVMMVPAQHDDGGQMPSYQQQPSDRADVINSIRPEEVIDSVKNELLGYEQDKVTGTWKFNIALKGYALTEVGAWRVAACLRPICNKNMAFTILEANEIRDRLRSIIRTTQLMALTNFRDFGIRTKDQMDFIYEVIYSNALAVLKQASAHGAMLRMIGHTIQEMRFENPMLEGKSNWWNIFDRFKRQQ